MEVLQNRTLYNGCRPILVALHSLCPSAGLFFFMTLSVVLNRFCFFSFFSVYVATESMIQLCSSAGLSAVFMS